MTSMQPPLGMLSAIPGLSGGMNPQQDKINRELFVGNTPPGTSELLLMHFLNAAMRRINLCQPHETPILNCRLNPKFAFIELVSAEMANHAMNMSGIPFLGAVLKISRPSKYSGPPLTTVRTWQQLTGAQLPVGAAVDAETEKMSRELFIGNTTPEMSEQMIREFLGNAMEQVGLNITPGNPIQACRVSGKFAFVELRSAQEATNALNLNNIPFMGAALRVGRPSKWNGPPDQHGNWEDILAKYMAGELQLGGPGAAAALNQAPAPAAPSAEPGAPTSHIVELQGMLTADDLANDDEYQEILEDTTEECGQFGTLLQVVIPKANEVGATKVFLEYSTAQDAAQAMSNLHNRTFDGRRVVGNYFDPQRFEQKDYA